MWHDSDGNLGGQERRSEDRPKGAQHHVELAAGGPPL
jgi:hypothetical protein